MQHKRRNFDFCREDLIFPIMQVNGDFNEQNFSGAMKHVSSHVENHFTVKIVVLIYTHEQIAF